MVPNIRLGVLSGSLVIIPSSAEPLLQKAAATLGIHSHDLSFCPLTHDTAYLTVEIHGEYYRGAVCLITSVFEQGGITVLVGTKSLLGEGWDAPCINTLVLASFVGSFVLSNQMRGRAIRVDSARIRVTCWHDENFGGCFVRTISLYQMCWRGKKNLRSSSHDDGAVSSGQFNLSTQGRPKEENCCSGLVTTHFRARFRNVPNG